MKFEIAVVVVQNRLELLVGVSMELLGPLDELLSWENEGNGPVDAASARFAPTGETWSGEGLHCASTQPPPEI